MLRIVREEHDGAVVFAVRMSKDAEEPPSEAPEPFYFRLADVDVDSVARAGLVLEFRTVEQVKPTAAPGGRYEAKLDRVLAFVVQQTKAGKHVTGGSVRDDLGMARTVTFEAIKELAARGRIVDRGESRRPMWFAATESPEGIEDRGGPDDGAK